ncbi:MAG TPA: L,D-transpeptidase [Thermoanaerobaculia bacterium]
MPERRHHDRPGAPERRSFPRPPLWLNLLLLLLGIGGVLYARYHRDQVSTRFARVIAEEARTPADVKKTKEELATMDLSREQLRKELEGRAKFMTSLKSENFYLAVDTKQRKLRFYYGDTVLREADLVVGESRTIAGGGKQWTFIPLQGAFPVEAKIVGHHWRVPEWVYAARNEPIPAQRPTVENGLGKYVIFLPNGYAIHTQPSPDSPLQGAKPGSYMVSEDVMRAIWPRIHKGTQVFIF